MSDGPLYLPLYRLASDDTRPALVGALLLLADVALSQEISATPGTVLVGLDRATWDALATFRHAKGWESADWPAPLVARFRKALDD